MYKGRSAFTVQGLSELQLFVHAHVPDVPPKIKGGVLPCSGQVFDVGLQGEPAVALITAGIGGHEMLTASPFGCDVS